MNRSEAAKTFVEIALMWIGRPYRWGGDDPMAGFDCSGLVVECLKSIGKIGQSVDLSAHGFFNRYRNHLSPEPTPGCLVVFSNKKGKIYHIGIYWRDGLYITADGGNSRTLTNADAIRQNAFVKIRPVRSRLRRKYLDIFELRG